MSVNVKDFAEQMTILESNLFWPIPTKEFISFFLKEKNKFESLRCVAFFHTHTHTHAYPHSHTLSHSLTQCAGEPFAACHQVGVCDVECEPERPTGHNEEVDRVDGGAAAIAQLQRCDGSLERNAEQRSDGGRNGGGVEEAVQQSGGGVLRKQTRPNGAEHSPLEEEQQR